MIVVSFPEGLVGFSEKLIIINNLKQYKQMKQIVIKIGGAGVKDTVNLKRLIDYANEQFILTNNQLFITLSANEGVTRLLRIVVSLKAESKMEEDFISSLIKMCVVEFEKLHMDLINGLFPEDETTYKKEAISVLNSITERINLSVGNYRPGDKFNLYSKLLTFGELTSSKIVHIYMNSLGIKNYWADSMKFVEIEGAYEHSKISKFNLAIINSKLISYNVIILPGFIGKSKEGFPRVLDLDASDDTASRLAIELGADEIHFFKDVDGLYEESPSKNPKAKFLERATFADILRISEQNGGATPVRLEAILGLAGIENIEIRIRSFINLNNKGTLVVNSL